MACAWFGPLLLLLLLLCCKWQTENHSYIGGHLTQFVSTTVGQWSLCGQSDVLRWSVVSQWSVRCSTLVCGQSDVLLWSVVTLLSVWCSTLVSGHSVVSLMFYVEWLMSPCWVWWTCPVAAVECWPPRWSVRCPGHSGSSVCTAGSGRYSVCTVESTSSTNHSDYALYKSQYITPARLLFKVNTIIFTEIFR